MEQFHKTSMPTRSATVTDEAGGTVVIDTIEIHTQDTRQLIFKRVNGGWELEVRHPGSVHQSGEIFHRMPITYTQANILGFMMRASRGDGD